MNASFLNFKNIKIYKYNKDINKESSKKMKKKKIYIIEDDEKYIENYIALFDQIENVEAL